METQTGTNGKGNGIGKGFPRSDKNPTGYTLDERARRDKPKEKESVLGLEGCRAGGVTLPFVEEHYKRLRSKFHPDKPDGDAEKFREVQSAWQQAQQELTQ